MTKINRRMTITQFIARFNAEAERISFPQSLKRLSVPGSEPPASGKGMAQAFGSERLGVVIYPAGEHVGRVVLMDETSDQHGEFVIAMTIMIDILCGVTQEQRQEALNKLNLYGSHPFGGRLVRIGKHRQGIVQLIYDARFLCFTLYEK